MRVQTLQPSQLVVELGSRLRIAVGRVDASDEHALDSGLDVPTLLVVRVSPAACDASRQSARPARESRRRSVSFRISVWWSALADVSDRRSRTQRKLPKIEVRGYDIDTNALEVSYVNAVLREGNASHCRQ
jgi:hypothetical protein